MALPHRRSHQLPRLLKHTGRRTGDRPPDVYCLASELPRPQCCMHRWGGSRRGRQPKHHKRFQLGSQDHTGRCCHSGHRRTQLWPKYAEYNSIYRRQLICRSGELRHRNLCISGCREGHGHDLDMGGQVGSRRPCHHQLSVINSAMLAWRGRERAAPHRRRARRGGVICRRARSFDLRWQKIFQILCRLLPALCAFRVTATTEKEHL